MHRICRRTFLMSAPATLLAVEGWAASRQASGARVEETSQSGFRVEERPYKKTPKRTLSMYLYFPGDWKEGDHRPAMVFFFGGGWQQGNVSQFAYQAEYLARRGMVAACADYRVKSRDGVGPKTCVEDAKSAVRWLRSNGARLGIDPDRIVSSGGSAGGHLAACTALAPDLVGEGEDPAVSSKTCAMILFNPVLNLTGEPRLLERVNNDETLAKLLSPTLYLQSGGPPSILFYGSLDRLLPQGQDFAARSRELGNRAELHVTPDQNHGFFNKPPFRDETLLYAGRFLESLSMIGAIH